MSTCVACGKPIPPYQTHCGACMQSSRQGSNPTAPAPGAFGNSTPGYTAAPTPYGGPPNPMAPGMAPAMAPGGPGYGQPGQAQQPWMAPAPPARRTQASGGGRVAGAIMGFIVLALGGFALTFVTERGDEAVEIPGSSMVFDKPSGWHEEAADEVYTDVENGELNSIIYATSGNEAIVDIDAVEVPDAMAADIESGNWNSFYTANQFDATTFAEFSHDQGPAITSMYPVEHSSGQPAECKLVLILVGNELARPETCQVGSLDSSTIDDFEVFVESIRPKD